MSFDYQTKNNTNINHAIHGTEKDDSFIMVFNAIYQNNVSELSRILNTTNMPSNLWLESLVTSHNQDKNEIVKVLVNHPTLNADIRNFIFSSSVTLFDSHGNNMALEWAKCIGNDVIRKESITVIDKLLAEKKTPIFHDNLKKQLDKIRNQIDKAIKNNKASSFKHNFPSEIETHNPLHAEMESMFNASENLIRGQSSIDAHPLFKHVDILKQGEEFTTSWHSGPDINDFTRLLLGEHGLKLEQANNHADLSLKIFNNVETFFRCFDIFKKYYEEKTGKSIDCDVSFTTTRVPLEEYCDKYIKQFPQLLTMDPKQREAFIRLLSVFNIGNDMEDLTLTLKMSVKDKNNIPHRSFKPISFASNNLTPQANKIETNEISLGQQNLNKQIQNLNGSELSMPYIKDADGGAQFKAMASFMDRQHLNVVDLGGGRGETNAVLGALQEKGAKIHLVNVEPHEPFASPYIEAHKAVGIKDVNVLQLKAQHLFASDVMPHFHHEKADVIFASHAFYFMLGDLHKATLEQFQSETQIPCTHHPLYKYFDMIKDDGVIILTLQTGAGARLFRNALLGNHGLNPPASPTPDESVPLLSSFGNMATLLRHFNVFAERYQKDTGKVIDIKIHYAVANVPLGGFTVSRDEETNGFVIHNPNGSDADPSWLAPTMLDFYGNWKELQTLATLTLKKAQAMSADDLKKLGIQQVNEGTIAEKREQARKMQETFLHILPVFAPAEQNMQHPNITLEIRVKS